MDLLQQIKEKACKLGMRIVLPEGSEERTLLAANILLEKDIAKIILLGNGDEIKSKSKELNLSYIDKATIINPKNSIKKEIYADQLTELRKHKGLMKDQALKLIEDPLYYAVMMIKMGDADGEVAGAINPTGNVLRPALQIIKTKPGISVVSGAFIMITKDKKWGNDGVMVFADCAVHPNPNDKELAEIAVSTALTTRQIVGMEPRIAMLSFSTKGSAIHKLCDKVKRATQMVKEAHPEIQIDGEMQADAAIIDSIAQKKCPGSTVAGKANVLVFPDLQSGNISYKLVQRLADTQAVGPILQGMAAPINDLSRGCSVNDIVNLVAITANQAGNI